MSQSRFMSPISLNLGLTPDTLPEQYKGLQSEFVRLYTAMFNLQEAFQNYCGVDQWASDVWSLIPPQTTLLPHNLNRVYCIAGGTIAYGAVVNLYDNAGVLTAQNANATNNTKPARAYCTTIGGLVAGQYGEFIVGTGLCQGISGMTRGTNYYLSTSDGQITATAPVAAGNIEQYLGFAISTSLLYFDCRNWIQH